MKKYYFIGIGGTGMSSLAFFLKDQGHEVWGSDRSFDQNKSQALQRELTSQGIQLVPQDGLHLPKPLDEVIYSSAVEKDNADLASAQRNSIPLSSRAQMLAQIFNEKEGIAVSGTSGKTTVVGMTALILKEAHLDFSLLCGGKIKEMNGENQSVSHRVGKSSLMVIEADESDGSLTAYRPKISLITNISKDHKDLNELYPLFQHFVDSTQGLLILNVDCSALKNLHTGNRETHYFGSSQAKNIKLFQDGSHFELDQKPFDLHVPGMHNVINALAAIAIAKILSIPIHRIQAGLASFKGIQRRLEWIGTSRKIRVYDDYSHNPEKIQAALEALKAFSRRIIVVYQPHGFGPLRLQWQDLIATFSKMIESPDHLYLLPVYDAGGTADRSISSDDLARELRNQNVPTELFQDRDDLISAVAETAKAGDNVIVMGARDDTLTELAQAILRSS